jgi:hypothetical protein
MVIRRIVILCGLLLLLPAGMQASSALDKVKSLFTGDSGAMTDQDFEQMAMQIREKALQQTRPPSVSVPTSITSVVGFGKYPWHRNIMTTVFWIGERPTARNPVPNNRSAWDANWARNYGGYDNPDTRYRDSRTYAPRGFIPRQNPFYIALPYCDVTHGTTKPEVKSIVPWFRDTFLEPGKSVLKGRWIAIHHNGRTAFAQWEDCGPFRTDHWEYVFGKAQPKPNLNRGAGLDISPAVRDYLGMTKNDLCDWKFVDAASVPDGPWKFYGDNNTFALMRKGANLNQYDHNNARGVRPGTSTRPSAASVPLSGSPAGVRVDPSMGTPE